MTAARPYDLLPQLTHFLHTLPLPAGKTLDKVRFCIGFSGGRDSVALLHLLSRIIPASRLQALHVHHGLSPHAESWATFCQQYCAGLGISLHVERVHVTTARQGLEAAARAARYAALADPLKNGGADFVALAHHADDQAETLLFNLLRGAGVQGAAAMPVRRPLITGTQTGAQLLRPLLHMPRSALESYLAAFGQGWIDDESNADTRFSRNYLRHQVLPVLQQRFPQAVSQLTQASQHFAEAQSLLDEIASSDAEAANLYCASAGMAKPGTARLRLAALFDLSPARQGNLLRHVLRQAGWKMPESRQLEELCRQLRQVGTTTDQQFAFRLAEGMLYCWQGELHWVLHAPPVPAVPLFWTGECELAWGGLMLRLIPATGAGISQQHLQAAGGVWLQTRQGGESLQIDSRRPRRPLKKLLQESGLPPWQRASLPLLFVRDNQQKTLIACAGIGIAPRWQARAGEAGWMLRWD